MSGLIDRIAFFSGKLLRPDGEIVDGKRSWSESPCRYFPLGGTRAEPDAFGRTRSTRVFLIAPDCKAPTLPGKLVADGGTFELSAVKSCRNLRGELLGWRAEVLGG